MEVLSGLQNAPHPARTRGGGRQPEAGGREPAERRTRRVGRRPGDSGAQRAPGRTYLPGISPGKRPLPRRHSLFSPRNPACWVDTEEAGANKGSQAGPAGREPRSAAQRRGAFGSQSLPTGRLPRFSFRDRKPSARLVPGHHHALHKEPWR